jgi:23S rRNA (adenine2030-N6)-methyltransferase
MLSYQHGYHAGNFADVMKHITLVHIMDYLTTKEKPLFYLETHAGRGLYDLKSQQAQKTKEFEAGIAQLWAQKATLPKEFQGYLDAIKAQNDPNQLRFYPGSPNIAIQRLRAIDRLILCEKHPKEFDALTHAEGTHPRLECRHTDGIESLKSLLPPIERRGLIFVDPSYEEKTEYKSIPRALGAAYKKFSTGVYCIWYPILNSTYHDWILNALTAIGAPSILSIEWHVHPKTTEGMKGTGMFIINPPFTLAATMKTVLTTLTKIMAPNTATWTITDKPVVRVHKKHPN